MALGIKKGDTVLVISGNDRPRSGKMVKATVLSVLPKKGMAVVEGVNIQTKHAKPRGQNDPGGITHREAPIRLSKLMLVDPKTGIASRHSNVKDENGNKVRRAKKTNNEV